MGFEVIENLQKSHKKDPVPSDGVRVKACAVTRPNAKLYGKVRFIRVAIGAKIAARIGMIKPAHDLRLEFGSGPDSGKIKVSVDDPVHGFRAKRDNNGNYTLTINSDTASGLFALEFPEFEINHIEVIHPENGARPFFVFKASAPMLAVED